MIHRKKHNTTLLLLLIGMMQGFASSPQLTQALSQYNVSEFEEARKLFRRAAAKDHEAFYFLGRLHALGQGVKTDLDSAAFYYRKGIASGDRKNHYGMFFLYASGWNGSEKDEVKAAEVLAEAYPDIVTSAKQSAFWKSVLGVMHYWGYHVPQDFDKAFAFYSEAAQQGWSMGQYNLGVMYEQGEGTVPNHEEAAKWYKKAADNGFSDACYILGVMYELGEDLPRDEKKAFQLYQNAASKRQIAAQIRLAGMYKYGVGTEADLEKAEYWYQQASASGDENADSQLAGLKGFKKLKYFRLLKWERALEQARQEKKLIFVDFYTTWCGPCRWMENNVFSTQEVEQFMSDKFVCLRINIEQEEEALVEKMAIESIPTLVFFDADGNVLNRGSGALESTDLISVAKKVIEDNKK